MPPVRPPAHPTIFQEVTFQTDDYEVEVLGGGVRRRIAGHAYCEITLRLPAVAELGPVIHDYDMSDAAKLRLIADTLDGGIPVDEPEAEVEDEIELKPASTGVRDWEV